MNPTIHSVEKDSQQKDSVHLTLEELDVMCRKCNHLHDEEIVKTLSRLWSRIRGRKYYEEEMLLK